jgi:hypothetical protein
VLDTRQRGGQFGSRNSGLQCRRSLSWPLGTPARSECEERLLPTGSSGESVSAEIRVASRASLSAGDGPPNLYVVQLAGSRSRRSPGEQVAVVTAVTRRPYRDRPMVPKYRFSGTVTQDQVSPKRHLNALKSKGNCAHGHGELRPRISRIFLSPRAAGRCHRRDTPFRLATQLRRLQRPADLVPGRTGPSLKARAHSANYQRTCQAHTYRMVRARSTKPGRQKAPLPFTEAVFVAGDLTRGGITAPYLQRKRLFRDP